MPMIPFIGVRISWLMLARNSDFALLAACAASRNDASVSSCCRITAVWPCTRRRSTTTHTSTVRTTASMAASTHSTRAVDHQGALVEHHHVVRRAEQQPEAPDSDARAVA